MNQVFSAGVPSDNAATARDAVLQAKPRATVLSAKAETLLVTHIKTVDQMCSGSLAVNSCTWHIR